MHYGFVNIARVGAIIASFCSAETSSWLVPPNWDRCASSWIALALKLPCAQWLRSLVAKGLGLLPLCLAFLQGLFQHLLPPPQPLDHGLFSKGCQLLFSKEFLCLKSFSKDSLTFFSKGSFFQRLLFFQGSFALASYCLSPGCNTLLSLTPSPKSSQVSYPTNIKLKFKTSQHSLHDNPFYMETHLTCSPLLERNNLWFKPVATTQPL